MTFIESGRKIKRAGLYVRVSTANQIERGESIERQEERLIAFCKSQGIDHYEVFRDKGQSAKDTHREGLESLVEDIRRGKIDCVLVWKLDRITRSLNDLLELVKFFEEHDVIFKSLNETIDTSGTMGRFMLNLLGVIAQLEREVTAERVASDMDFRARAGKWNGGPVPYGYTTQSFLMDTFIRQGMEPKDALPLATERCPETKKLYIDDTEASIVIFIFDTYISGGSVRGITHLLNKRQIKNREGKPWSKNSIHGILKNPLYVGQLTYGKRRTHPVTGKLLKQDESTVIVVEGEHQAIISQDVFAQAMNRLAMKSGRDTKPARNNYLLKGVLRCGLCGGAMSGQTSRKAGNRIYSYYKCVNNVQKGNEACVGVNLPAKEIEEFIVQKLLDKSNDYEYLTDKQKMLEMAKYKLSQTDTEKMLADLEKRKKKLVKIRDLLFDKLERQIIDDEDFKERNGKVKEDLAALERESASLHESLGSQNLILDQLKSSYENICTFGGVWDLLDDAGKAMRIKSIVKEIRATREKVEMQVYADVNYLSGMGRGASRR